MPIVFVHGVANRKDTPEYDAGLRSIERLLREYVCPTINAQDPKGVKFLAPYWGDVGVRFAWNRTSCPGGVLGMGVAAATPLQTAFLLGGEERLREAAGQTKVAPSGTGVLRQGSGGSGPAQTPLDLKTLTGSQISDLAATIIQALPDKSEAEKSRLVIAADLVAHDPAFQAELANRPSPNEQAEWMFQCIQAKLLQLPRETELVRMGGWDRFKDGLQETLSRAASVPGAVITESLAEIRGKLNSMFTLFIGDVFVYLSNRKKDTGEPGEIPQRVIDALREAKKSQEERPGEPLIVLTHSMGGQIIYDLVTDFLPAMYAKEGIKVDFWCATASQVGLFEEMKLFLKSDPQYCVADANKAPLPPGQTLGVWWNVWDPNDFLSFRARDIFSGVRDESYESGLSVARAHSGSLQRPSFYRKLAAQIDAARTRGFK
jgi:hypothetical protein